MVVLLIFFPNAVSTGFHHRQSIHRLLYCGYSRSRLTIRERTTHGIFILKRDKECDVILIPTTVFHHPNLFLILNILYLDFQEKSNRLLLYAFLISFCFLFFVSTVLLACSTLYVWNELSDAHRIILDQRRRFDEAILVGTLRVGVADGLGD